MSDLDQFVHLHVHSDYSLLDGLGGVSEIVEEVVRQGGTAAALTDHGTMAGAVKLVQECAKHGIKPIVGLEAYHVPDHRVKKKLETGKANWHLILLAKNNTGYRNLMHMSSIANTEGRFGKWGRLDDDILRQYSEGIIATTACLGSRVNQALMEGKRDEALEYATIHRDIFGADNYFVEIQDHGIPEQREILQDQVWLAKKLGVGLLATNDCHFVHPDDANTHETLLTIGTGGKLFDSQHHYMRSPSEMIELFPEDEFPGAITNTVKLAEIVDLDVNVDGKPILPEFDVPPEFDSPKDLLRSIVLEGASELYGDDEGTIPGSAMERIEYELGIINEMGFNDYFLILSDALRWARNQGIMVGPGRGSAAGSIAVYCARITDVDPLQYGLYFERFLNPGRASMPDIDIDIEDARRGEVIDYIVQKYGKNRVSRIASYGYIKARSAIRDSVRVSSHPSSLADEILRLYPPDISQVGIPLNLLFSKKSEVAEKFHSQWDQGKHLRKLASRDEAVAEIVDTACSLEGTIRGTSLHAGGILVTPTDLWDLTPIRLSDADDIYAAEYDKYDSETVGGLKIDLLGLTSLSMIRRTLSLIQSDLGKRIDIRNIPLDDPDVYKNLSEGNTEGVFQLSTDVGTSTITRIQPTRFEDISAAIALGRPGPMASNMHIEYADRKAGRSKIETLHPEMSKMLENELGLPFYQENIMALAQTFAGYTAAEADKFRKAMGSKDSEVMAQQEELFRQGVLSKGHDESLADGLWALIEPFSGYAFNKSHSVAYAMVSYQTAWLKTHYPAQYAAASIDIMPSDKVPQQIEFCRKQGVHLYAPDINKSQQQATTSKNAIWLGLSGIKQCGEGKVDKILAERIGAGAYQSLGDFLARTGTAIPATRSLIYSGAFDGLHLSRKAMLDDLENIASDAKIMVKEENQDQDLMLFEMDDDMDTLIDSYNFDIDDDYSQAEKSRMEMDVLGFFVGHHPFTEYAERIEEMKRDGVLAESAVAPDHEDVQAGSSNVDIYGIITELSTGTTKSKNPYTKFYIETGRESRIAAMIFGRKLKSADQGRFISGNGSVKVDSYNEREDGQLSLQFMLDDIDFLDSNKGRPKRGSAAKRSSTGRRRGSRSPAKSASTAPNPEEVQEQVKVEPEPVPEPASEPEIEQEIVPEPEAATPEPELKPIEEAPSPDEDIDVPDEPESKVVYLDAARRRTVKPEGTGPVPKGYRFLVSSESELRELSQSLTSYGTGQVAVIIFYMGEEIKHDKLMFDLTEERARYLSEHIGVEYRAI